MCSVLKGPRWTQATRRNPFVFAFHCDTGLNAQRGPWGGWTRADAASHQQSSGSSMQGGLFNFASRFDSIRTEMMAQSMETELVQTPQAFSPQELIHPGRRSVPSTSPCTFEYIMTCYVVDQQGRLGSAQDGICKLR